MEGDEQRTIAAEACIRCLIIYAFCLIGPAGAETKETSFLEIARSRTTACLAKWKLATIWHEAQMRLSFYNDLPDEARLPTPYSNGTHGSI